MATASWSSVTWLERSYTTRDEKRKGGGFTLFAPLRYCVPQMENHPGVVWCEARRWLSNLTR